jgi:hypothetical protein
VNPFWLTAAVAFGIATVILAWGLGAVLCVGCLIAAYPTDPDPKEPHA